MLKNGLQKKNEINSLKRSQLTGLINLKYIGLNANFLSNIEPFTFCDLKQLSYLDLSFNYLRQIEDAEKALKHTN